MKRDGDSSILNKRVSKWEDSQILFLERAGKGKGRYRWLVAKCGYIQRIKGRLHIPLRSSETAGTPAPSFYRLAS